MHACRFLIQPKGITLPVDVLENTSIILTRRCYDSLSVRYLLSVDTALVLVRKLLFLRIRDFSNFFFELYVESIYTKKLCYYLVFSRLESLNVIKIFVCNNFWGLHSSILPHYHGFRQSDIWIATDTSIFRQGVLRLSLARCEAEPTKIMKLYLKSMYKYVKEQEVCYKYEMFSEIIVDIYSIITYCLSMSKPLPVFERCEIDIPWFR